MFAFAKRLKLLISFIALSFGCDSSKKNNDDAAAEVFPSRRLSKQSLDVFDGRVALSADGQNLTFISGRHLSAEVIENATSAPLKVYLTSAPLDQDLPEPERLTTNDDLGSEIEAKISPDGTYVAITHVVDGNRRLSLFNRGDSSVTEIGKRDVVVKDFQFSPDSQGFAFSSLSEVEKSDLLKETVALGNVSTPQNLSDIKSVEDSYRFFSWLKTSSGYSIAAIKNNTSLSKFESSNIEGFSSAEDSEFLADKTIDFSVRASLGQENLLISEVPTAEPLSVDSFVKSDFDAAQSEEQRNEEQAETDEEAQEETELKSILIQSKLALVNQSGVLSNFDPIVGHKVLSLSADASATRFLAVISLMYTCETEDLNFGSAMIYFNGTKQELLIPRYNQSSKTWDMVLDPCEKPSEEVGGGVDLTISQAVIGGTADSFRIVYVSNFIEDTTEDNQDETGNQQVRAVRFNGDSYIFQSLEL